MNENKKEIKEKINSLIKANYRLRTKQTAWIEVVCNLRTRISESERKISANDKEIKELKKQLYG